MHRLLPSPSDKHVALIGDDGVNILELQRHRGPCGEFGGGYKTVNCKCTPIDQDYFVARKQADTKIVLHAEWINECQLAMLMSDESIRYTSTIDFRLGSLAMGKHLVQALPSVYALQCQTGKEDKNSTSI